MNINDAFGQNFTILPLYFFVSFGLSLFLTRLCITLLPYFGMVDVPRGRHRHRHTVPRGGGLAIILSFVMVTAWYFLRTALAGGEWLNHPILRQFTVPLAAVTVLGVLDDRYELRSIVKLLVQVGIGIYFYFTGAAISQVLGFQLPWFISLPVTVCWVIGIINAFNLIDGMDGIAAGLAMISAFTLAIWQMFQQGSLFPVICLLTFCGSCAGFLRYNFSPARIFMGDTGSLFIGMFFAYFSIVESEEAVTLTSLLVPVLAVGIPIFDVILAIFRRLYRKYILKMPDVGIMTGDHDHLHHRLQDSFKNSRKTAFFLYTLASLLAFGGLFAAMVGGIMQTLSFLILLAVLFSVIRYATIEFYDAATLISEGIRIPHRKMLLTAFHPVLDCVLLFAAYSVTSMLFQRNITFSPFTVKQMLCYIAPFPLILSLSGIYRTYWMRAGIVRYYRFLLFLGLSALLSLAISLLVILQEFGLDRNQISMMREFFAAYVFLGILLILLERFFLHYMESYGFKRLGTDLLNSKKRLPRTLIYGGGLYCRLFLLIQSCASSEAPARKIIGLLDDDSKLRGLNVYGKNVLGTSDELEELYNRHPFDEIVIALRLVTEETRQKLMTFGRTKGIPVREFRPCVTTLEAGSADETASALNSGIKA